MNQVGDSREYSSASEPPSPTIVSERIEAASHFIPLQVLDCEAAGCCAVLYCQCDQTGKRHLRQKSVVLQGYSAGFHLLEFSNHCDTDAVSRGWLNVWLRPTYTCAGALVPHQCPEGILALPDVVMLCLLGDLDTIGGTEEDWFQYSHGLVDLAGIFVSLRVKRNDPDRRGQPTSPWGGRQKYDLCPSWDRE